jgi:hypothetical protein
MRLDEDLGPFRFVLRDRDTKFTAASSGLAATGQERQEGSASGLSCGRTCRASRRCKAPSARTDPLAEPRRRRHHIQDHSAVAAGCYPRCLRHLVHRREVAGRDRRGAAVVGRLSLASPVPADEISVSAERWDVSFEVSNLVVWARTLVERLETKTRVGGVEVKIGLLPALADSDRKDQVQRFHDELAGWVEAEGYLAGFALHIGRLHGGSRASGVSETAGSGSCCRIGRGPGLVVGGVHLSPQSGRKNRRGGPARAGGAVHGWAAHQLGAACATAVPAVAQRRRGDAKPGYCGLAARPRPA